MHTKRLILKGLGVIDPNLSGTLKSLFRTRNDLAHDWSFNSVKYEGLKLLDNFEKFSRDLERGWTKIIQLYRQEQIPKLDGFVNRMETEIANGNLYSEISETGDEE